MRQAVKHAAPKYRKSLPLFTPEYSLGIPTFTKRFFETLYERLGSAYSSRRPTHKVHKFQGSVIVIDNYQDVPPDSQFHEIVRTGLEVAPPGAAIIIISRNDPPAVFARLFSNGLLHLIDWNAVQFTLKETRDLIQFKENKRPDEEEIRTLYKITQGWVAGLVLLSENIIRGRTARDMGGAPRNLIFDYFASELFNLAHPDIQDFLMKTSFLPQMTLRIASDLTGNERSEHIINTISRHNFFIQRHATPEIVYQYHPLFREFLLSRAK